MDSEEDTAAVAIAAAENPGDSQIRRSVKTFDFDEFPLPPLKVVVPEVSCEDDRPLNFQQILSLFASLKSAQY